MANVVGQVCIGCGEFKNFSEYHFHAITKTGYRSKCKVCVAAYDAARATIKNERAKEAAKTAEGKIRNKNKYDRANAAKALKPNYSEINKRNNLRRYSLTLEEYQDKIESQSSCCALCGRSIESLTRGLHVDHDHKCCPPNTSCGKCIRGLLCHGCNTGLGAFQDDINLLRKAIEYLQKWGD